VEEATAIAVEQLAKLDGVVHDFMACMPQSVVGPVESAGVENLARFQRILFQTTAATGHVLGPPVLCGMSPPIGIECLLGLLGSSQRTGILRVLAGDTAFMISIVRGDVVHGISDPRPESELLGNILLARGAVNAEQLRAFFEECGSTQGHLVDALNREKLVSTVKLREALTQQMQRLFDRLLAATHAEWCFHEGEATLCYVNMRVNVNRVLLESARKHDEGNAFFAAEPAPVKEPLRLLPPAPRPSGRRHRIPRAS
jgi:hypothetical protein